MQLITTWVEVHNRCSRYVGFQQSNSDVDSCPPSPKQSATIYGFRNKEICPRGYKEEGQSDLSTHKKTASQLESLSSAAT